MKPISAQHKYALRYEMTADALNFRELAFRQTSPRRPPFLPWPHQPPSQPRAFPELAVAIASSYPSVRGPSSGVSAGPGDPLVRPLRLGQTLSGRCHVPSPAGRAQPTRPPHGACLCTNSELSPWRSRRGRDGYLPARPSSGQSEKDQGFRQRRLAPSRPASPSRSRPAHTHAFAHACAQMHAHICTHSRTQTLPRALTPAHTQGYNKGRGGSAVLLFSLFSSLLQTPNPGAGVPAHPALRAPRRQRRPAFRSSASERQLRARAPAPRGPAGGRQKLRRRRRPRGQGVLANCQEMCVCAPGARRGGEGAAGGRGREEEETHPPAPATRQRPAPEPGLENKLSALFSLGCG